MKNISNNQGFTLIELMVTVAIIGILTLMAQPFYQDYVMRTHIAQAISETVNIKTDMYEAYALGAQDELQKLIDQLKKENPTDGTSKGTYRRFSFKFEGKVVEEIFPWVDTASGTKDLAKFGYQIKLKPDIFPKNYVGDRDEGYIGVVFVVKGSFYVLEKDDLIRHQVNEGDPPALFCGQTRDGIKTLYESIPVALWLPQGCRDLETGFNGYTPIRDAAVTYR